MCMKHQTALPSLYQNDDGKYHLKSMSLNIRHLLSALEIYKCGQISKATAQLHLTQSALTQGIHKLECQLGYSLFDRTRTGMNVTHSGKVFLERVLKAFNFLECMAILLFDNERVKSSSFCRSITFRQLKALIHLVEFQSYTGVSQKLNLSTPTIHRTIKGLEQLCEEKLFYRRSFGMVPTSKAKELARLANFYFEEIAKGKDAAEDVNRKQSDNIIIGGLALANATIVPESVIALLEVFPNTHVKIVDGSQEELLSELLQGNIDIIVGALQFPPPSDAISQSDLFTEELSVVSRVGHPKQSALDAPIFGASLSELKWIAPGKNSFEWAAFCRIFTDQGLLPPTDVIECNSLIAIRALLLNSDRVAILSDMQIAYELITESLQVSNFPSINTARTFGIIHRKRWKPTPIQSHFISIINQLYKVK